MVWILWTTAKFLPNSPYIDFKFLFTTKHHVNGKKEILTNRMGTWSNTNYVTGVLCHTTPNLTTVCGTTYAIIIKYKAVMADLSGRAV